MLRQCTLRSLFERHTPPLTQEVQELFPPGQRSSVGTSSHERRLRMEQVRKIMSFGKLLFRKLYLPSRLKAWLSSEQTSDQGALQRPKIAYLLVHGP